jgi:hypothetical protein
VWSIFFQNHFHEGYCFLGCDVMQSGNCYQCTGRTGLQRITSQKPAGFTLTAARIPVPLSPFNFWFQSVLTHNQALCEPQVKISILSQKLIIIQISV